MDFLSNLLCKFGRQLNYAVHLIYSAKRSPDQLFMHNKPTMFRSYSFSSSGRMSLCIFWALEQN
jgi:hypothetical protein